MPQSVNGSCPPASNHHTHTCTHTCIYTDNSTTNHKHGLFYFPLSWDLASSQRGTGRETLGRTQHVKNLCMNVTRTQFSPVPVCLLSCPVSSLPLPLCFSPPLPATTSLCLIWVNLKGPSFVFVFFFCCFSPPAPPPFAASWSLHRAEVLTVFASWPAKRHSLRSTASLGGDVIKRRSRNGRNGRGRGAAQLVLVVVALSNCSSLCS